MTDLVGQTFGKLTPIYKLRGIIHGGQKTKTRWYCVCDCGGGRLATTSALRQGGIKACRECGTKATGGGRKPKHGLSTDPVFAIWKGMIRRCTDQNHPGWQYYGGIGIKVCDRWVSSFEAFIEDLGMRPDDPPGCTHQRGHYTLDRIDPSGNYEPSNVRWATWTEQAQNRRSTQSERPLAD